MIPEEIEGLPVTAVGDRAFLRSAFSTVQIPDSVERIGDGAFTGCGNLTEITIPETVTEFGKCVFGNCPNLKILTLPENMTEIPFAMFESTGIEKIIIPENVQNIDYFAFALCKNLKGITILNPDCEIAISSTGMGFTFSTGANAETAKEYFNGIIYGYENFTVQEYAKQFSFKL
ncbi:MAG: leucine-rich repeat domain-containing protein [Ruminococcus sp.]|nr:leucine-rich repeat domain-containing protein [Ruminococcus sp.]